jgi:hypothetical protein
MSTRWNHVDVAPDSPLGRVVTAAREGKQALEAFKQDLLKQIETLKQRRNEEGGGG